MNNQIKTLIGQRIRLAREEFRMKQHELASALGIRDAQTVSSIECGTRNVKPEELISLMNLFKKDLDFFTNPYLIPEKKIFSWRKSQPEISETAEQKARNLISLYQRCSELNNKTKSVALLKIGLNRNCNNNEIENRAEEISNFLELGEIPSEKLRESIEDKLGVPILYFDASEEISGATFNLPAFCGILINRQEVEWRRNYDLAHEFFHILTCDIWPPHELDSSNTQKCEKSAEHFAACLLMPRLYFHAKWNELPIKNTEEKIQAIAKHFRVSPSAVYWRLVNLKLISSTQVQLPHSLCSSNSTPAQYYNKFFVANLHACLISGKISIRQVCFLLDCDDNHLHEVFSTYGFSSIYDI